MNARRLWKGRSISVGKAGPFSVERLKMDLPSCNVLCVHSEVPVLLLCTPLFQSLLSGVHHQRPFRRCQSLFARVATVPDIQSAGHDSPVPRLGRVIVLAREVPERARAWSFWRADTVGCWITVVALRPRLPPARSRAGPRAQLHLGGVVRRGCTSRGAWCRVRTK